MEATEVEAKEEREEEEKEDAEWKDRIRKGKREGGGNCKGKGGEAGELSRFNEKLDVRFFCYEILSNVVGTY